MAVVPFGPEVAASIEPPFFVIRGDIVEVVEILQRDFYGNCRLKPILPGRGRPDVTDSMDAIQVLFQSVGPNGTGALWTSN